MPKGTVSTRHEPLDMARMSPANRHSQTIELIASLRAEHCSSERAHWVDHAVVASAGIGAVLLLALEEWPKALDVGVKPRAVSRSKSEPQ